MNIFPATSVVWTENKSNNYPKGGGLSPVAGPTQTAAPLFPGWPSQPPGDAVASRHIAPCSESDTGTHTHTIVC